MFFFSSPPPPPRPRLFGIELPPRRSFEKDMEKVREVFEKHRPKMETIISDFYGSTTSSLAWGAASGILYEIISRKESERSLLRGLLGGAISGLMAPSLADFAGRVAGYTHVSPVVYPLAQIIAYPFVRAFF